MTKSDTLNRLVFIKYLHTLAQQQASKPEPLNATAILALHDTVELFLQLAVEEHPAKKPNGKFLGYWEAIRDKQGNPPTQRPAMERLNRARNNLKHGGIRPAHDDVDGLAAATALFLTENTGALFGTSFDEIGLHQLIGHPHAREQLRAAAVARARHQPVNRHHDVHRELKDRSELRHLATYLDHLTAMVREMHDSHTVLSLGINYRDYNRFRTLTPSITRTTADDPERRYRVDIPLEFATRPYTDEELDFCTDFVISTGLSLMAFPRQNNSAR